MRDIPASTSSRRRRYFMPVMRGSSPRQNQPWCTSTASAPASRAASSRARLAVTPVTRVSTSPRPSTWRPLGQ